MFDWCYYSVTSWGKWWENKFSSLTKKINIDTESKVHNFYCWHEGGDSGWFWVYIKNTEPPVISASLTYLIPEEHFTFTDCCFSSRPSAHHEDSTDLHCYPLCCSVDQGCRWETTDTFKNVGHFNTTFISDNCKMWDDVFRFLGVKIMKIFHESRDGMRILD